MKNFDKANEYLKENFYFKDMLNWGYIKINPLIKAVIFKDINKIKALIEQGANLNVKNSSGISIIKRAFNRHGDSNIVKILKAAGYGVPQKLDNCLRCEM